MSTQPLLDASLPVSARALAGLLTLLAVITIILSGTGFGADDAVANGEQPVLTQVAYDPATGQLSVMGEGFTPNTMVQVVFGEFQGHVVHEPVWTISASHLPVIYDPTPETPLDSVPGTIRLVIALGSVTPWQTGVAEVAASAETFQVHALDLASGTWTAWMSSEIQAADASLVTSSTDPNSPCFRNANCASVTATGPKQASSITSTTDPNSPCFQDPNCAQVAGQPANKAAITAEDIGAERASFCLARNACSLP